MVSISSSIVLLYQFFYSFKRIIFYFKIVRSNFGYKFLLQLLYVLLNRLVNVFNRTSPALLANNVQPLINFIRNPNCHLLHNISLVSKIFTDLAYKIQILEKTSTLFSGRFGLNQIMPGKRTAGACGHDDSYT